MKPTSTVTLALGLAAIALVLGVLALVGSGRTDIAAADTGDLDRRVAELERRLAASEGRPAPQQAVARRADGAVADAALPAKVLELERRVAALESRPEPAREPEPAAHSPQPQKTVPEWQQDASDRSLTAEQRLQALRALRGMGSGARGEPVLSAMIELAETSADPEVRADVWRQMSGAREAAMVPALMRAVLHDPHEKVREEAAETLADYLDHPGVVQTLQQVGATDASEQVRDQASRSLRRSKR